MQVVRFLSELKVRKLNQFHNGPQATTKRTINSAVCDMAWYPPAIHSLAQIFNSRSTPD